jgi:hypothetical protein
METRTFFGGASGSVQKRVSTGVVAGTKDLCSQPPPFSRRCCGCSALAKAAAR